MLLRCQFASGVSQARFCSHVGLCLFRLSRAAVFHQLLLRASVFTVLDLIEMGQKQLCFSIQALWNTSWLAMTSQRLISLTARLVFRKKERKTMPTSFPLFV